MHLGDVEQVVAGLLDFELEAHPLAFAQAHVAPGADVTLACPGGGVVVRRADHALAVLGLHRR